MPGMAVLAQPYSTVIILTLQSYRSSQFNSEWRVKFSPFRIKLRTQRTVRILNNIDKFFGIKGNTDIQYRRDVFAFGTNTKCREALKCQLIRVDWKSSAYTQNDAIYPQQMCATAREIGCT